MAYEDRILRMVKRPKPSGFSGAKDRYISRTRGGYPFKPFRGYRPKRSSLQGRGLGSFENQMMMDQLAGPAGMNLANQPQKSGSFLNLLEQFKDNLSPFRGKALESLKNLKEEEEGGPRIIPIPTDLGSAEGDFIGNTGYHDNPYFEMGSGIEYTAPIGGGTSYTGVPWGDADYNLGRVFPDPNEVLRPVEKRQFPMDIPWLGYNRGGIASLKR
jgi:hypothetical protein